MLSWDIIVFHLFAGHLETSQNKSKHEIDFYEHDTLDQQKYLASEVIIMILNSLTID